MKELQVLAGPEQPFRAGVMSPQFLSRVWMLRGSPRLPFTGLMALPVGCLWEWIAALGLAIWSVRVGSHPNRGWASGCGPGQPSREPLPKAQETDTIGEEGGECSGHTAGRIPEVGTSHRSHFPPWASPHAPATPEGPLLPSVLSK